jgi:hypothetical protein
MIYHDQDKEDARVLNDDWYSGTDSDGYWPLITEETAGPVVPLVDDTVIPDLPKLDPLKILQDARLEILTDKKLPFNSLAFWFLCDAISYLIYGRL